MTLDMETWPVTEIPSSKPLTWINSQRRGCGLWTVIRPGHIQAGTESAALVNGTDILPTLCELGGAAVPGDRVIDGVSLVSVFQEKKIRREIPAFWMFPAGYSGFPLSLNFWNGATARDPGWSWH